MATARELLTNLNALTSPDAALGNTLTNVKALTERLNGPGGALGVPGGIIGGGAQAEYGNMQVPSVWRTNRTAATARVDALSSGGMDDLEIPAFLRKQAD